MINSRIFEFGQIGNPIFIDWFMFFAEFPSDFSGNLGSHHPSEHERFHHNEDNNWHFPQLGFHK